LYALSFNDVDVFIDILLKENVIIVQDNDFDSISQIRSIALYVKDYLQHLDIMKLVNDIQMDTTIDLQHTNFRLNEKYYLISRTLTLLEGTCKGLSDDFSYVRTMMQGLLDIDINFDMLIGKIQFDINHLTKKI